MPTKRRRLNDTIAYLSERTGAKWGGRAKKAADPRQKAEANKVLPNSKAPRQGKFSWSVSAKANYNGKQIRRRSAAALPRTAKERLFFPNER